MRRIVLRLSLLAAVYALMAVDVRPAHGYIYLSPHTVCTIYCAGTTPVCAKTVGSVEFCAGYFEGCMTGCGF